MNTAIISMNTIITIFISKCSRVNRNNYELFKMKEQRQRSTDERKDRKKKGKKKENNNEEQKRRVKDNRRRKRRNTRRNSKSTADARPMSLQLVTEPSVFSFVFLVIQEKEGLGEGGGGRKRGTFG